MLRIRQCFKQCGISQQELVSATGWSKALISRVFSTGVLPVNLEKFTADLTTFAEYTPPIAEWLVMHDMSVPDLLKPEGHSDLDEFDSNYLQGQIDQAQDRIITMAGEAAVIGPHLDHVLCMARLSCFLLATLRAQPMAMDALGEIEIQVNRFLMEG